MATPMTLFDDDGSEPVEASLTTRVRLTVAYDGTSFHGFALNPGVPTVGGRLTEALERILRHPVEITCAGRTDRGVHAHGQVVDFATRADPALDDLCRSVNALCGPAIAVREPRVVPAEFSSRFDALSRRYRYTVWNDPTPDPFSTSTAWHVPDRLNLALLQLACDPFIGTHDFTSFCRRPKRGDGTEASLLRDVHEVRWVDEGDGVLRFWIEASSFCHQMVRSIVGTMIECGRGRMHAGDIRGVLAARDRGAAGPVAPPQGLSLWQVRYPEAPDPVPAGSDTGT